MITPFALLAAVVFLMFARAKTRRLARLRAAQEAWAEDMDRPSRRFRIDPQHEAEPLAHDSNASDHCLWN